ncbi:MAG TPA: DUF2188 domain-containing protein [Candidatus Absconditabacterales bacterium]|nr:DUF2188 domain-containing protein [Candidatus Absconditabacterales bacterium]
MTTRNTIRVLPDGGNWKVTYNQSFKKLFQIKSDAIEYGKNIAKNNQPSQIVIHRADGTIEIEYTYGNDPFPPRG